MGEYIERLYAKFGSNAAMFQFENYNVLADPSRMYNKLLDINKIENNLDYENQNCFLRFPVSKQSPQDLAYLKSFRISWNLIQCLTTSKLEENISPRFRRLLVTLVNNRYGKSISNT